MALEIEGTLAQKLPVQSGNSARGPWAKQEFILEFPDGNFTAKACFTAWGQEKVQDLGKYQVGDKVKVSFNLKSREYNGRWYNDLQIWKIVLQSAVQIHWTAQQVWKSGMQQLQSLVPILLLLLLRLKR